ncbi:MAG TPA: hypothetical protein VF120_02780 [Ktedonobacterales bacterium]
MFTQTIIDTIVNQGILVAQKAQSPFLYPYLLGAIAASILLGVLNVITSVARTRRRRVGRIIYTETRFLILHELAPIYALWLAFATPYGSYFFGASWFGLLLHGALAIYGAWDLSTSWIIQIYLYNSAVIGNLAVVASLILVAFGWEIEQWPLPFIMAGELVLSFFIASLLAGIVVGNKRLIHAHQVLRALAAEGYSASDVQMAAKREARTMQILPPSCSS